jgi:hypothetical protein
MGELWTDEIELELQRWQAIKAEAENPKDFLIPDPDYRDVVVGIAHYLLAATRYWVLGGTEPPLPLKMLIDTVNIHRQIGPARLKEQEEWLKADPMVGDPFEGLFFDDD